MPFSERVSRLKSSLIREILAAAQRPEVMSFAGGLPAESMLPKVEWAEMPVTLGQYGMSEGEPALREVLAAEARALGIQCDASQILVVSGQATFTANEPVPPTAKLTVSLYSASAGDTPAGRLAKRTLFVKQPGQVPFRLDYAPAKVKSGERYLLSGRILLGGRPLYLTQEPVAVDLSNGGEVELPLQPVR